MKEPNSIASGALPSSQSTLRAGERTRRPASIDEAVLMSALSANPGNPQHHPEPAGRETRTMLRPRAAWRILCRSTGGEISLVTFYRWLSTGKVYSIRLGHRIFIPLPALEEVIKQCRAGERF